MVSVFQFVYVVDCIHPLHVHTQGLHRSVPGPLCIYYDFWFSVLWDSWVCEQGFLCFLLHLFPSICSANSEMLVFIISYHTISIIYFVIPWMSVCFLMGDKKKVDQDHGGEWGKTWEKQRRN